MKWNQFHQALTDLPWFDVQTVRTLFPREGAGLTVSLYRWKKAGRVLELRRGFYTLAAPFRRAALNPAALANHLYAPSCLSLEWALSWYGIIPEHTVTFTSVTTREPAAFSNNVGTFTYQTVKPARFFGYARHAVADGDIVVASPAKALCDFWYLNAGEWTLRRMESFRFDPEAAGDPAVVLDTARAFASPRIARAARAWLVYREEHA